MIRGEEDVRTRRVALRHNRIRGSLTRRKQEDRGYGRFHDFIPRASLRLLSSSAPVKFRFPKSSLAVCLVADRFDLGRVGIIPDPLRLSTSTAKTIANNHDSV